MHVVFTGGRDFKDQKLVHSVASLIGECTVHVGDCPTGLDKFVRERFPGAKVYKANWDSHGRAAGPIRNKEMCFQARWLADVQHEKVFLIAFPGGRGTQNCIQEAGSCEIPVLFAGLPNLLYTER